MKWFGEPWPSAELPAPVCENPNDKIDTPVHDLCLYCGNDIQESDQGVVMPGVDEYGSATTNPIHRICLLKWTGIYSIVEG